MANIGPSTGLKTRAGFNVEIKFEGEWIRFNNLINSLDINLALAAKAAQLKFAEQYKNKLKANIRTGGKRFGYPEHSIEYAKYKRKHYGPNRLLYWSGAFQNAIQVMGLSRGRVGVGIPRGVMREPYHAKEGKLLSISEYANILEHGSWSRNIPARPIFADTFKQDMGGMVGLKTFLSGKIIRGLNKKGILATKI